ncbi:MAG: MoxR family ATPase [Chloroflexota bacterium]|jgi:MoxR-like ATPase
MESSIAKVQVFSRKIADNLETVIVGKTHTLELVVISLLCQGHLLIDDVPGVGKTILARSLAKSLGVKFSRIQFTPDMLPSDVTGVSIFNQVTREFEYRPGPVMAQIVLADEINRATPKTQSALLEAMEEHQVTVDGTTYPLPSPFLVLATQNPIEYEGTFPLPEAQLDRFFMRIKIGYPSLFDEMKILELQQLRHPIEELQPVADKDELLEVQHIIRTVHVSKPLRQYIVELTRSTRENNDVYLGSSPRGSLGLYRAGQARAAIHGRDYVLPDDIKILAENVLAHRMVVQPAARLRNLNADQIIHELIAFVPVPGGELASQPTK